MKIGYNYLTNYIPEGTSVDEVVKRIGSQLGEVEGVENLADKYKDVLLVKVVSVEKHPDADKLNVCLVDDGGARQDVDRNSDGLVQIVCGAPNVRAGMMAAWLPPGAVVPETYGTDEPFTLGARELRGITSNGMLASLKELDLGASHDGILDIDVPVSNRSKRPANEVPMVEALSNMEREEWYKPGDSFADTFALNDYIIDIENKMFTRRPDCFGKMGIAREVAAIFGMPFESEASYRADMNGVETSDELEVRVETDLVPRFTAQVVEDVDIKPSTLYRQIQLLKVGIRPINNIVDITNHYMHETGQPLHAYDYDKLAQRSSGKPTLVARMSSVGETVNLLDGRTITFDRPAIVIATDTEVVGIGGAMGGADTEVDENTKNVVFEVATFDMYSIRRTSMHYGLFTEAVTRFNKGQSPHQNASVLAWAVEEAQCTTREGEATDSFVDIRSQELAQNQPITLTADFINTRLGSDLPREAIITHLQNVEFSVQENGEEITATAPFWRTDIHIKEDIVEEIGRLHGYDNLPLELPTRSTKATEVDELLSTKEKIRSQLAAQGANELLTHTFVHRDVLTGAGQDPSDAYGITNAISPELHYYRQTLVPSLLNTVNGNVRLGYSDHTVFEIGKTHNKKHPSEDGIPGEIEIVGLVTVQKDTKTPAFYAAKEHLVHLAASFGHVLDFAPAPEEGMDYPITKPYDLKRSAMVSIKDGPFVGMVGEFAASTSAYFKLPQSCAGFEVDTAVFGVTEPTIGYTEQSKFPSSSQDVTLQVGDSVTYAQLENAVESALQESGLQYSYVCTSMYKPDSETTNTTFSITLSSLEKTLTTEEVNQVVSSVVASANKIGASQV